MFNEDPAKAAVITKFKDIATRYAKLSEDIKAAQEQLRMLELMAQDCHSAARLFGFELIPAVASHDQRQNTPDQKPLPKIDKSTGLPKPKTIKKLVLEEAKAVYPEPIRARAIREKLEALRGEVLHEKTIGMTLYRLLKEGALRRNNWDWYYIPEDERLEKLMEH